MRRYVILRHETPPNYARPLHWDLMLEFDGALWTWALEAEPHLQVSIVAWGLPDHRLDYLTYEGPVSGERGSVSQWDAGIYEEVRREDDELVVRLAGRRLQGSVTLRKTDAVDPPRDDQRWTAWFAAE
jgi:hypothetical protein